MPAMPLPFVVALLLTILLIRVALQDRTLFRPVNVFIGACILLVVTVGLRWTIDVQWIRFLQPVIAALLPPIAWLCFAKLRGPVATRSWPHFVAPAAILILSTLWYRWHSPIDLILALLYFGYGTALVRNGYAGPDHLESMRLSDAEGARKAVYTVGGALLSSGVVDLLIAVDFDLYQGSHAASVVAAANILALPVVAYAIAVIGRSVPDNDNRDSHSSCRIEAQASRDRDAPDEAVFPSATEEDHRTFEMVDTVMRSTKLYRDPDLTLNRLSRRLGIPSRRISIAINRTLGRNVPQVVNEYRVGEAVRLLIETDLSITTVMFECGFQTKSNFNREFTRVTGTTPSDYRRSGELDADEQGGAMAWPEWTRPESRSRES